MPKVSCEACAANVAEKDRRISELHSAIAALLYLTEKKKGRWCFRKEHTLDEHTAIAIARMRAGWAGTDVPKDQRDLRIAELEVALRNERARFDALRSFCQVEMRWDFFREEMLGDSASGKNAEKLQNFLMEHPRETLTPAGQLDAAIATAKREALEEAADRAEETAGVLTDDELRRMAREVKP